MLREEDIGEVICGMARGADAAGKDWAVYHDISVWCMPANWEAHGKRAGFTRNRQMAERADVGIGFWKKESGGTANMVTHLVLLNKLVLVVEV
jgi:hypothetical protein